MQVNEARIKAENLTDKWFNLATECEEAQRDAERQRDQQMREKRKAYAALKSWREWERVAKQKDGVIEDTVKCCQSLAKELDEWQRGVRTNMPERQEKFAPGRVVWFVYEDNGRWWVSRDEVVRMYIVPAGGYVKLKLWYGQDMETGSVFITKSEAEIEAKRRMGR